MKGEKTQSLRHSWWRPRLQNHWCYVFQTRTNVVSCFFCCVFFGQIIPIIPILGDGRAMFCKFFSSKSGAWNSLSIKKAVPKIHIPKWIFLFSIWHQEHFVSACFFSTWTQSIWSQNTYGQNHTKISWRQSKRILHFFTIYFKISCKIFYPPPPIFLLQKLQEGGGGYPQPSDLVWRGGGATPSPPSFRSRLTLVSSSVC